MFALADLVIGNVQMALFAAFGGFATLVMSGFGGTRRDKAVAHLGLALTGTVLVAIGTLVSSSTLLASLVTLPVAFLILFAGAIAPNAATGAMGALLAFVLPAVSAGTASMIPSTSPKSSCGGSSAPACACGSPRTPSPGPSPPRRASRRPRTS